jgi:SAM-dependent methyltransferase
MADETCRACGARLGAAVIDLGTTPLCESFVSAERYNVGEPIYPLRAYVCATCFLVQLGVFVRPEDIFTEYAYFSSFSDSWVRHAARYAETMRARFALGPRNLVVEIGSNDGYLLQHFVAAGIPVLGIDPAANVAEAARARGVTTLVRFFGRAVADEVVAEGRRADLIAGNNVLAQVPDLHDVVAGLARLLAPRGVVTIEVPHLLRLIEGHQFDTIYPEHFSYFSLRTLMRVFGRHALRCFDVEELESHGGSLRIFVCHADDATHPTAASVAAIEDAEQRAGLEDMATYVAFAERVRETKRALLTFLIEAKRAGKSIAGYGAPGKGNTLLNYCGIGTDFLDYTVDRNPYKHGRFLPGSRIPIFAPEHVAATRPDYLLVLPWNLTREIVEQMAHIRSWGGKFVIPIPTVQVVP